MNCSVTSCERAAGTRGLCATHYMRWLRNGSTDVTIAARGDGWTNALGYHLVGHTLTHVAIATRALGHTLPHGAVVHHADGDPSNNKPDNLVICPSQAYHKLLHVRLDALKACGNHNFRKCAYCGVWDDPANMLIHQSRRTTNRFKHRACDNAYQRARRTRRGGVVIVPDGDFA